MPSLAKDAFAGMQRPMVGGTGMGGGMPPVNMPPMAPTSSPMPVAPVPGTIPPETPASMVAPSDAQLLMALLNAQPAPQPAPQVDPGYEMRNPAGGSFYLSQDEYRQGRANAYDKAKNSGIPERKKKPAAKSANKNRQTADKQKKEGKG